MFGSTRKKLQKQSSADRVSTKFVVPQNLHWIEKREFFSIFFFLVVTRLFCTQRCTVQLTVYFTSQQTTNVTESFPKTGKIVVFRE